MDKRSTSLMQLPKIKYFESIFNHLLSLKIAFKQLDSSFYVWGFQLFLHHKWLHSRLTQLGFPVFVHRLPTSWQGGQYVSQQSCREVLDVNHHQSKKRSAGKGWTDPAHLSSILITKLSPQSQDRSAATWTAWNLCSFFSLNLPRPFACSSKTNLTSRYSFKKLFHLSYHELAWTADICIKSSFTCDSRTCKIIVWCLLNSCYYLSPFVPCPLDMALEYTTQVCNHRWMLAESTHLN